MRKHANGDITFPKRGKPPACPDGYYRDKGDPFLFHLDIPDCEHRDIRTFIKPCKELGLCIWCKHFQKEVNSVVCNDCPVPEE